MASCGSLESKLVDYENACYEGDVEKAAEAFKGVDIKEKYKDLTPVQQRRFDQATTDCVNNVGSNIKAKMSDMDVDIDMD